MSFFSYKAADQMIAMTAKMCFLLSSFSVFLFFLKYIICIALHSFLFKLGVTDG